MNESGGHWGILGVDPAHAGGRDVKRAYARLLKIYRPDQDPEGFRRVHEAYQTALAELEGGAGAGPADLTVGEAGSSGLEDGPAAETLAQAEQEMPVEPAVREAFERTLLSLPAGMAARRGTAEVPEFSWLRDCVRGNPGLGGRWAEILADLTSRPGGAALVVQGLHPQDVWLLMKAGHGQLAAGVASQWRQDLNLLGRLTELALLLLEKLSPEDREHPARLPAMHFAARAGAFYFPETSARLVDEFHQLLEPGVREQLLHEIEVRITVGKAFSRLSLPMKRFWEHRIFEAGESDWVDWWAAPQQQVLKDLMRSCPRDWDGWAVVSRVVPEEVLQDLADGGRARRASAGRAVNTGAGTSGGGRAWVWILGFILVKGIVLALLQAPDKPARAPVPSTQVNESFNRAIQEARRRESDESERLRALGAGETIRLRNLFEKSRNNEGMQSPSGGTSLTGPFPGEGKAGPAADEDHRFRLD